MIERTRMGFDVGAGVRRGVALQATLLCAALSWEVVPRVARAQAGAEPAPASGLEIGAEAPAFDPQHVAGPDRGTHACPMCKYGYLSGAMIWVNTEQLSGAARMASRLERELRGARGERVKAFVIYMNPGNKPKKEVEARLAAFAREAGLRRVAVAYVPSPTDADTSGLYRINPDPRVETTVFVYSKRRIFHKFVNLAADETGLDRLVKAVELAEASRGGPAPRPRRRPVL